MGPGAARGAGQLPGPQQEAPPAGSRPDRASGASSTHAELRHPDVVKTDTGTGPSFCYGGPRIRAWPGGLKLRKSFSPRRNFKSEYDRARNLKLEPRPEGWANLIITIAMLVIRITGHHY